MSSRSGESVRVDRPTADILRLAREQHGVVSRRQLVRLGISERLIEQRVSAGRLLPVFAGVYGVGHDIIGHRGWWSAALLSGGDGAVLSHTSAAACWGLLAPRNRTEIIRDFSREPPQSINGPRRSPNKSKLVVHRTTRLPEEETTTRDGFPTTTVPRTILNLAATRSESQLEGLVAEAERMRLLDWRQLRDVSSRGKGWAGVGKLREIVGRWHPDVADTKSGLESRFLQFCRARALPDPIVNTYVEGYEVDCVWKEQRLIVELDSVRFHSDLRTFERDRRKDTILTRAGYEVRRVTHEQLRDDPEFVMKHVLAAIIS